jgi:hypothetical protein
MQALGDRAHRSKAHAACFALHFLGVLPRVMQFGRKIPYPGLEALDDAVALFVRRQRGFLGLGLRGSAFAAAKLHDQHGQEAGASAALAAGVQTHSCQSRCDSRQSGA